MSYQTRNIDEIPLLSFERLDPLIERIGKDITTISSQLTFTCSKSIIETLEKGVKYVQSNNKNTRLRSDVFVVNLKHISLFSIVPIFDFEHLKHISLFSIVPIFDFEQLNVSWAHKRKLQLDKYSPIFTFVAHNYHQIVL